MEQKCFKCGGVLFKKVILDEGGKIGMDTETKVDLEFDGVDSFFRCPHCYAKNVIVDVTRADSPPQIRISDVKE